MNTPDLNLVPTIQLWNMANADPANEALQDAVVERERQRRALFRQNGADSRAYSHRRGTKDCYRLFSDWTCT